MRCYHTGHHELRNPDIRIGRKNADFGQGFYLSPSDAFAGKWVREQRDLEAYVNTYELDLSGLKVLRLQRNETWFDYIFRNRAGLSDRYGEYDLILGPIANDTIYTTFGVFTSGLLPKEQVLSLLQIGPSYEQIVIKTDRARRQLRWLSSRTLDASELSDMRESLLREEAQYQQALADAFSRFELPD